ncbi:MULTISPECIES: transposase [Bosea]|jgi:hypothetical protein|uniref:transposase n=1 Tax=Bosea TaxID=85413 RepID=UPI0006BB1920|nr:transposase [Bosea vaviloviae]
MNRESFWRKGAQFARVEPHLPTETHGKPRVDDRWLINGIVQCFEVRRRCIDVPVDNIPRKTLYNRYVR